MIFRSTTGDSNVTSMMKTSVFRGYVLYAGAIDPYTIRVINIYCKLNTNTR